MLDMHRLKCKLVMIAAGFGLVVIAVVFVTAKDRGAASTEPIPAEPLLYVTAMTHLEGNLKDDVDEDLFLRHVAQMRFAMDLFDEYGAKLTFESEQSFARANTNWQLNILREAVERGHGVGTHADFGA